ncbi:glycosyltransferase family 2 protein [Starkeya sp. 3C]|uniref:Glycosyltransferase family 2 protein n=1 Tax=Ancylobacter moscoviensis TaxID=2597768 RepID=A0ABY3DNC2_9HYPH|nr:glycosyltransferase family 2 protein [Ancylobacter moscoviensis]TSJ60885.1 glycosyltransferase family 2 protein [Ancylobacter moscoviensis]
MLKALAVVCVRNEAVHMRRCLRDLIGDGLDVFLIDNDSTDGSTEIASEFLGHGLLGIERIPWTGAFSLSDQLRAKRRIIADADHDWIVHTDADEWLCSPVEGQSLLGGIREADAAGYTCINFHEIVFVPLPGDDFLADDYASRMSTYYFFQPVYPRLNRAWKRTADIDSSRSSGHRLAGDGLRLYPQDFFLRHYIALSEGHARSKYVGRKFSDEDIAKGWHDNRRIITAENLHVKQMPGLMRTPEPLRHRFDLSTPLKTHFWQW